MKAAIVTRYGPPDVVVVDEVPKPTPRAGEVLVRVHETTVNRSDYGELQPGPMRVFYGFTRPRRTIFGLDFAGVVEATGPGAELFKPSDRVFGMCPIRNNGAHAEYVCVPETGAIATIPANVAFEEAVVCEGAFYADPGLRKFKVGPGHKILIYGASGAIGIAALQLAKVYGAEVTAVVATRHLDLAKSLGADRTIDYIKEDFTKIGERFDFIFDAVGKASFVRCRKLLKPDGIFMATDVGPWLQNLPLILWSLIRGNSRVVVPLAPRGSAPAFMAFLKDLMQAGKFRAVIDRKYPLDEIADAYRYVATKQKTGVVVITVVTDDGRKELTHMPGAQRNRMSETVLVTGGTGFVGGWCIVELLRRGYDVRTAVRDLSKEPAVRAAIATETDAGSRLSFFAADLNNDAGWDEAVQGADYVLHVASPLGTKSNGDALIAAARDGTLRVLAAARKAKVKRVVLTSSTAASAPEPSVRDAISDETVWSDPTARGLTPYRQSKIYAERAAWEFMKSGGGSTELTTILPTGIFGPVLTAEGLGSVQLVQRLLNGSVPGTPNVGFNVVDVRDLADLHIRAMTAPEATGQRFIGGGQFLWMADIARILREHLGERAKKVPKRNLPNILLRFAALTNPAMKEVTAMLGHKHDVTSAKAEKLLGWKSRAAETAILDCAESLFAKGAV